MSIITRVLVLTAALSCVGCLGRERQGYLVTVQLSGSARAFEGRSVWVSAKRMPDARLVGESHARAVAYVELCTADRSAFLRRPVPITVREGAAAVASISVQRVACRDAAQPGDREDNYLVIDDAGRIQSDFGSNPEIWATCHPPDDTVPCPHDEL